MSHEKGRGPVSHWTRGASWWGDASVNPTPLHPHTGVLQGHLWIQQHSRTLSGVKFRNGKPWTIKPDCLVVTMEEERGVQGHMVSQCHSLGSNPG